MLITMIANLILIHILSVIWSTGQVTSEETPVHVSADVYETIIQQLTDHPPDVSELDEAKAQYGTDYKNRSGGYSEVCEWGKLATELNEPTNDICIIVAVALKDRNVGQASSSSPSGISDSPSARNYDCRKIPIANMITEETDTLEGDVGQKVLVCPQITIEDPSTHEPITSERFLIADGGHEQNSIFVFGFSDNTFEEMNLKFYLSDILRINMIKVSSRGVQGFQQQLNDLQQEIELNVLCDSPITERQNVCKYAAMKKFNEDERPVQLDDDFDFDATYLDTSGYVPYRCFKRYTAALLASGENFSIRFGIALPEDHIYCPKQHIKLGDSVVAQDGFFYSVTDDMYEKLIHIKQVTYARYRTERSIEEKTVIPFPKRS